MTVEYTKTCDDAKFKTNEVDDIYQCDYDPDYYEASWEVVGTRSCF